MKQAASRALLAACLLNVGFLLALKMWVTCSSEMPVQFYQTTWYYIPDNRTLHYYCCQNLTFGIIQSMFTGMRESKDCNSKYY
jgi:hypothetical protein